MAWEPLPLALGRLLSVRADVAQLSDAAAKQGRRELAARCDQLIQEINRTMREARP